MQKLPQNWKEPAPRPDAFIRPGCHAAGQRRQAERALHTPPDECIQLEELYYLNFHWIPWHTGKYTQMLLDLSRNPDLNCKQIADQMNYFFDTTRFTSNAVIGRITFLKWLMAQRKTLDKKFKTRHGTVRKKGAPCSRNRD